MGDALAGVGLDHPLLAEKAKEGAAGGEVPGHAPGLQPSLAEGDQVPPKVARLDCSWARLGTEGLGQGAEVAAICVEGVGRCVSLRL